MVLTKAIGTLANQMNQLPHTLHNDYVIVRHAHSIANEAGIITSNSETAMLPTQGLTPLGRSQVTTTELPPILQPPLHKQVVVYTSDFTRAMETAELLANRLGLDESVIHVTPVLRERNFGTTLEGQPNTRWELCLSTA